MFEANGTRINEAIIFAKLDKDKIQKVKCEKSDRMIVEPTQRRFGTCDLVARF